MIATVKTIQAGKPGSRVPVRKSGDELDELGTLFNQLLERIDNLIGAMRSSLDNVAHDLRTPATRLRSIVESALQSEKNGNACREALADCMEESERILSMLNTLMDISEAENGVLKLNLEEIPVAQLLQDTIDLYQYVAEDKGIQISSDCPQEIHLTGDRNRLGQVLANLLDNAIKYTDPGGRITFRADRKDNHVIISVIDSGLGITPEEIPHIWDRLYRGKRSRTQKGLGLGLSLVRAVVKAHKGTVEVFSEPGKGSIFTISLKAA
jgi:signal transduction histidine kinase